MWTTFDMTLKPPLESSTVLELKAQNMSLLWAVHPTGNRRDSSEAAELKPSGWHSTVGL